MQHLLQFSVRQSINGLLPVVVLFVGCVKSEQVDPPEQHAHPWELPDSFAENPALGDMLTYYEKLYNPNEQLLQFVFRSPGYHSSIPIRNTGPPDSRIVGVCLGFAATQSLHRYFTG